VKGAETRKIPVFLTGRPKGAQGALGFANLILYQNLSFCVGQATHDYAIRIYPKDSKLYANIIEKEVVGTVSMTSKPLMQSMETSSGQIGLLAAKLSMHPFRRIWSWRAKVEATCSASAMNGMAIQKDRLLMRLAELDIPMVADAGAEARSLAIYSLLTSIDRRPEQLTELCRRYGEMTARIHEDSLIILDALRASDAGTALLALADVGWTIRRERDASAAPLHHAMPVWFTERLIGNSGTQEAPPLYNLVAWPERRAEEDWKVLFLGGIGRRASSACRSLDDITLSWRMLSARLHRGDRKRRSDSKADEILLAAFLMSCVSPAWISAHFDISLTAAGRQLQEMVDLGIMTEVTSRSTHKSYALSDLPLAEMRQGRGPRPVNVVEAEEGVILRQIRARDDEENLAARLDLLIEGIDAAVRRSLTILTDLGVVPAGKPVKTAVAVLR